MDKNLSTWTNRPPTLGISPKWVTLIIYDEALSYPAISIIQKTHNFLYFHTTKTFNKKSILHISECAKFAYSNVEFQKFSSGDIWTLLQEQGKKKEKRRKKERREEIREIEKKKKVNGNQQPTGFNLKVALQY